MKTFTSLSLMVAALLLAGACATKPTVETRRQERADAYAILPADQRALVDQGQIKVGMNEDAVYIAWGKPAQQLVSEDASGRRVTWLYHGTTTDEYVAWRFYEVPGPNGTHLARRLDRDFNVREYISAELVFRDGALESWRTLARPGGNTFYAPAP
ncbi:MAG TPA: hypothetical protein DCY13_11255 [Verrucomicrobiales bacterium]|nr:hypothetical protein [Verrucomicrobiales bacterium]